MTFSIKQAAGVLLIASLQLSCASNAPEQGEPASGTPSASVGDPVHSQVAQGQPEWQSSFPQFIDELKRWDGKKPKVTLETLSRGGVVPADKWDIMKKYGGQTVRWSAVFGKVAKASDEYPDQGPRIELKMDAGNTGANVAAFALKDSEAAWHAVEAGAQIQLEGRIVGIQFDVVPVRRVRVLDFGNGITSYWVTVFDTKLLGIEH
ncbi:MAG: hypothetical protein A3G76_12820 [Acidobacteria bacterium RIFCSPLOWO2_12_FULL_65_11]|nr:MAG: hypothetical protein A3G76_12820 [Acidobacteria bacterium RIFCSPLOWO2_12_FULL_65_11]